MFKILAVYFINEEGWNLVNSFSIQFFIIFRDFIFKIFNQDQFLWSLNSLFIYLQLIILIAIMLLEQNVLLDWEVE